MRDIYFSYAHLPAHLQAISKPFSDASKDLSKIDWLIKKVTEMNMFDQLQKGLCIEKLLSAKSSKINSEKLQLILEAKDCAVRASIPNPSK